MEFDSDHLPIKKPPKPTIRPSCSPEINVQLNVTPEKKGLREPLLRREERRKDSTCQKENAENNAFNKPTINSTAIVSKKLLKLNQSKFDASLVVKQELQRSEKLRLDIAEKASGALNYNLKDSKYTGLVSLDVSTRNLGIQQRKVFKERQTGDSKDEPDIMTFMSDDLQFESATLSCDCCGVDDNPKVFVPSTENVFKLYEHIECWKR